MTKLQEALVLICMLAAFGLGYGFHRAQTAQTQTEGVKTNHTVVTTVTSKDKNGTVRSVRTIDSATKSRETKQSTLPRKASINISGIGGYDLSHPRSPEPVYGISVTREIIGPVTVGVFGLSNGILGLTVGVNF